VDPGLGQRHPYTFRKSGVKNAKAETIRYHEAFVFRGGSTWLDVAGATNRVTLDVPSGFEVATALPKSADGSYTATDHATLIASPMHVGKFRVSNFVVDGVSHRVVLSGFGRERTDIGEFESMLARIIRANRRAMGRLPYADYVFLFGRQSGRPIGTGHPRCTEIITSQFRTSPTLVRQLAKAHLAAWDGPFFHPVAWGRTPISGSLTKDAWFWLGARDYLTELAVTRAGIESSETFWTRTVASRINSLQLDARRLKTTVAETGARIRTPDDPIRPGAPHPRLMGFLLCLLLDVEIRANTGGRMSIDHAIRGLAAQCANQKHGYTSADIQEWCQKVGGRKFQDILACVTTLKELPLTSTLTKVGVEAHPGTRPQPKKPISKRIPARRRRPPRWRVTLPPNTPPSTIKLRAAITNGT
jgi:predicted metalloprotease with PDZ domain